MAGRRQAPDVPLHLRLAWTPAEVGAMLGKSEGFVRAQIAAGAMRVIPHSVEVLVAAREVERWCATGVAVAS